MYQPLTRSIVSSYQCSRLPRNLSRSPSASVIIRSSGWRAGLCSLIPATAALALAIGSVAAPLAAVAPGWAGSAGSAGASRSKTAAEKVLDGR